MDHQTLVVRAQVERLCQKVQGEFLELTGGLEGRLLKYMNCGEVQGGGFCCLKGA